MTDINAEKLKNLNFKNFGLNWIGKIENYFFTVQDKLDSENQLIIYFNLAPNNNRSKLFEYFDALQSKTIISEYSMDKNEIRLLYTESLDSGVDEILKEIVEKLKEIEGKNICDYCDETEFLSFYTNGTVHSLLCPKCAENVINKVEQEKKTHKNYVKGFFACLLGALIGSVLWILIGALGFFASIAGLAISICAFKGYAIAKGKLTRFGIVLNVIAILIAFIFAQYSVLFIQISKEIENLTIPGFLAITPVLFSNAEFLKALLPDIGFGLLFIFLGAYRTVLNNLKSAKDAENFKVEKVEL
ncbi:MAG: hypothetical protein J6X84_08275 [Treponema sp.]|nr:hypothetical protein [Treponema sp.]